MFCNTLTDIKHLSAYFVDRKIITTDDLEEIQTITRSSDKVGFLLRNIVHQLKAQFTDGFYYMLDIMKVHGLMSTQELASKILRQLNPSPIPSVEPEGKSNMYIHVSQHYFALTMDAVLFHKTVL